VNEPSFGRGKSSVVLNEVAVIEQFIKVFLAFLVIMDPFVSALYFIGISKDFSRKEKRDAVNLASMIAGITLVVFLFGGPVILELLGISIPSFKIAGGLVLLIISINFILGTATKQDQGKISKNASVMIIGVPLITGPGVLTTIIILRHGYGLLMTSLGALASLVTTWLFLMGVDIVHFLLRDKGMEIASRIMGLLLAAIAIQFILDGFQTVGVDMIAEAIKGIPHH
jgi:multiple antibiotic resistance protein